MLLDFGYAYQLTFDNPVLPTNLRGTVGHIAPEVALMQQQLSGEPNRKFSYIPSYSPAADVFSLGVVLYNTINGYYPFELKPASNPKFADYTKVYPYYCDLEPEDGSEPSDESWKVSNEIRDLIQQMLCIDPKKRIRFVFSDESTRNTTLRNASFLRPFVP